MFVSNIDLLSIDGLLNVMLNIVLLYGMFMILFLNVRVARYVVVSYVVAFVVFKFC